MRVKNKRECRYSEGTIKIFRSNLNSMLEWAVDEGYINLNPNRNIVPPKGEVTFYLLFSLICTQNAPKK